MNGRMAITGILAGAVALLAALGHGRAASQPAAPACKIGLVSIQDVLTGSKKYTQYRAVALKRQAQAKSQIETLTREIETAEAELKTLKAGTPDYLKQLQAVLETRAKLQTQQEYLKQQRLLEDKKAFEDIYQAVLRAVGAVAKEKGLDLVLERTEPKFPMTNEELSNISTYKVLYGAGCVDLTGEVAARVDADETLKP